MCLPDIAPDAGSPPVVGPAVAAPCALPDPVPPLPFPPAPCADMAQVRARNAGTAKTSLRFTCFSIAFVEMQSIPRCFRSDISLRKRCAIRLSIGVTFMLLFGSSTCSTPVNRIERMTTMKQSTLTAVVCRADPRSADAQMLLDELSDARPLYWDGGQSLFDIEDACSARGGFVIARTSSGAAIGCGAFRIPKAPLRRCGAQTNLLPAGIQRSWNGNRPTP